MDGRQQALLEGLVVKPEGRLEGRDHVAHHIFRRIVQQRRQPRGAVEMRVRVDGDLLDQHAMLGDRKGMVARGLPVPARHAGKSMRDVLDLDVERRGVEQVEPRPDSMRCQARGASSAARGIGNRLDGDGSRRDGR